MEKTVEKRLCFGILYLTCMIASWWQKFIETEGTAHLYNVCIFTSISLVCLKTPL